VTAAALCGAVGVGPAHAGEDPTEAVADLIGDVAPDQGQVVKGAVEGDQIVAEVRSTEVSVPVDPDQPIVLDGPGSAPTVTVSLPAEVTVDTAQVADDGTVVYHATDDGASAAVQVLDNGSTRLQTITPDANGPREFTYTFGDGIVPVVHTDRTVSLVRRAGGVEVALGSIEEAWAVDAAGEPVETAYRVDGRALVQVVVPSAETSYPVVADPSVSLGRLIYVKYDKSEVKRTVTSGLNDKLKYQAILCAVVPVPAVQLGCGFVAYDIVSSIAATTKTAYRNGRCVEIDYTYNGLPVSWKTIACSTSIGRG